MVVVVVVVVVLVVVVVVVVLLVVVVSAVVVVVVVVVGTAVVAVVDVAVVVGRVSVLPAPTTSASSEQDTNTMASSRLGRTAKVLFMAGLSAYSGRKGDSSDDWSGASQ